MAKRPNRPKRATAGPVSASKKRKLEAARKPRAKAAKPLARARPARTVAATGVLADLIEAKQKGKAAKVAAPPPGDWMTVPLDRVFVAKENPRHGQPVEMLEEITASLRSHTQLQDVICYKSGERFAATDGARRLAGLEAGGAETVRIVVHPKERAIELGVAAQVERVNLHPADEAVTFARMLKGGDKLAQVAGAFGKTERYVLQRQKLAGLHPPILAALRWDAISIDKAAAWANVPEDRQPSLWKRLGQHCSVWQIRDASEDGRIENTAKLALFVGEDAYLAAGGQPQSKLFKFEDEDADATWDEKLVDKLAAEKIEAAKEKYLAEGWGWVEFAEGGKPWDVEKHPKPAKTAEDRKARGVYLSLGKTGQLNAEKNLVSAKAAAAAKKKTVKAKSAGKGAAAPADEAAPADDGLMTNAAHERLTRAAGFAIGRAMLGTSIGMMVIVAALARRVLGPDQARSHPPSALRLRLESPRNGFTVKMKENAAWDAAVDRWRAFARDNWATLELATEALSDDDLAELSSVVAALLIDSVEFSHHDSWGGRRRLLAQIGAMAGCRPDVHWAPDVEFLKGLSRASLEAACEEVGIKPLAAKGKTAQALAIAAADKGWTPHLFAQICGFAPPPPPEEGEDDPFALEAGDDLDPDAGDDVLDDDDEIPF